jgi:hypothetical protein
MNIIAKSAYLLSLVPRNYSNHYNVDELMCEGAILQGPGVTLLGVLRTGGGCETCYHNVYRVAETSGEQSAEADTYYVHMYQLVGSDDFCYPEGLSVHDIVRRSTVYSNLGKLVSFIRSRSNEYAECDECDKDEFMQKLLS